MHTILRKWIQKVIFLCHKITFLRKKVSKNLKGNLKLELAIRYQWGDRS
jgi:hypothetical protein